MSRMLVSIMHYYSQNIRASIKTLFQKRKKAYTKVYTKKRKVDLFLEYGKFDDTPDIIEVLIDFIDCYVMF
jgi:hypothetical protein